MSWPADGKPRFMVSEITGGNGNVTLAILDRAFCHREVTKFRSEDWQSMPGAKRRARELAAAKLAELNAGQVAA